MKSANVVKRRKKKLVISVFCLIKKFRIIKFILENCLFVAIELFPLNISMKIEQSFNSHNLDLVKSSPSLGSFHHHRQEQQQQLF